LEIDYESWFVGLCNHCNGAKPDFEWLFGKLETEGDVIEANAYADFSNPAFASEIENVRAYATTISTAASNGEAKKDSADFVILDALYKKVILRPKAYQTVALVTGDGHFVNAARFLREVGKDVIVFSVSASASHRLAAVATKYYGMPEGREHIIKTARHILIAIKKTTERYPDFVFYAGKTVRHVTKAMNFSESLVQEALDVLVAENYIARQNDMIFVDWEKVVRDNLAPTPSLQQKNILG
jgi:NADPH-dependent glutamate synthase beta subunit-like oxidoreductase